MIKSAFKGLISILISYYKGIVIGKGSYIQIPFHRLRGRGLISIGKSTSIGKNAWIDAINKYSKYEYSPRIIIGDNVTIGNYLCLVGIDYVSIADGCLLSEYIYISDHYHGYEPGEVPLVEQPLLSKGRVEIGRNCFIGYRVSILSGVSIGDNCVIGSHAVITKSFPPYSMIAVQIDKKANR